MSRHPILGSSGGMAPTTSRRIVLPLFLAAIALVGAAPAAAQSVYPIDNGQLTVQNNRDVPVTVYLEGMPVEKRLGTIEPMRTATFDLPSWALRRPGPVKLFIHPKGQFPLEARVRLGEGQSLRAADPHRAGSGRRPGRAHRVGGRHEPPVARVGPGARRRAGVLPHRPSFRTGPAPAPRKADRVGVVQGARILPRRPAGGLSRGGGGWGRVIVFGCWPQWASSRPVGRPTTESSRG